MASARTLRFSLLIAVCVSFFSVPVTVGSRLMITGFDRQDLPLKFLDTVMNSELPVLGPATRARGFMISPSARHVRTNKSPSRPVKRRTPSSRTQADSSRTPADSSRASGLNINLNIKITVAGAVGTSVGVGLLIGAAYKLIKAQHA